MRLRIVAALAFMASATAAQAQTQPDLRHSTWQRVNRTTIYTGDQPTNASVTFLATGYDLTRAGNAVVFRALTIYKHPVGLEEGYSVQWQEYLADCSTLQLHGMMAWSKGRRGWGPLLTLDPRPNELTPTMPAGQMLRGACGLLPLNGQPTNDPERAARDILATM